MRFSGLINFVFSASRWLRKKGVFGVRGAWREIEVITPIKFQNKWE